MQQNLKAGHFYGQTLQALAAGGFRFTEKLYSARAALPMHAHELPHFCLVLAGNYHERIGAASFEREPAALVYYPPDVSHAEEHLTGGRHFLVEIDLAGLERVREYGARLQDPVQLGANDALWLAARMYREFSERDMFSVLALESISMELLIAASRRQVATRERKPPVWLGRVKDDLRENFPPPPKLGDLARAAGVHQTHLARVFRQFEHCTVGDFVRRVRIENAQRQILASKASLVDIALATGFTDQTHFNRSFRRVTGMTPTGFRRVFSASR
ncbi:MAG: helix-turn-helix transcriptional regulator [Pyrinomonadaceae bacterium]